MSDEAEEIIDPGRGKGSAERVLFLLAWEAKPAR